MSIGELKRELIDLLGDPSVVFQDKEKLIAAISAARKMSDLNGNVMTAQAASSSHRSRKMKIHASPAVIPTIDEESEAKHSIHIDLGSNSRRPRIGGRASSGKDKRSIKSKRSTNSSSVEQESDSVRLVEYFIVVSSKPSGKSASDIKENVPPNPALDELDSRTEMRYESRSAHLPGGQGQGQVDHVHLSSIGFRKSLSTSSTCSSEDYDASLHSSGNSNMLPTSTNFSGVAASNASNGNLLKECVLEPVITARYPAKDRPKHPLNPKLPQFCHPEGSEYIFPTTEYKMPKVHHFVLTESNAGKLYGTCLTVYEEFDQGATEDSQEYGKKTTYYAPRVLCLLSSWPYLTAFRSYLTELYRLATTTDLMEAPIERYILNICEEVPAPQPGEFEVQLSILGSTVRFWAPPANQPIAYVSLPFHVLFECLDISNVMYTWYSLACEHKVLLVSDQLR